MRVVVLGGGFGGLIAAYEVRKGLPSRHEVFLVSNAGFFVFRPSLPWVVLGSRRPHQITADLAPALHRRGISFVQATVERIDPERRRVMTTRGDIEYDYLVAALGAHLDREAVPGLDPHTDCIMWLDDALRVREKLERFAGGDIAVLEVQGTPIPCAAYEIALGLDAYLRRRGLREKTRIHFLTHAKAPFDVGGERASYLIARELSKRGINWRVNAPLARVEKGWVRTEDGQAFRADLILAFPPYRGTDAVLRSGSLADERGFIPCGATMESTRYPDVFAVGDAVAFAGPKSGRMAELQARVAARNVVSRITQRGRYRTYQPHLMCALDMGAGKGLFAYRRETAGQGPAFFSTAVTGRWPVMMKAAVEKYFLAVHF